VYPNPSLKHARISKGGLRRKWKTAKMTLYWTYANNFEIQHPGNFTKKIKIDF
jgi:hypothetical protein